MRLITFVDLQYVKRNNFHRKTYTVWTFKASNPQNEKLQMPNFIKFFILTTCKKSSWILLNRDPYMHLKFASQRRYDHRFYDYHRWKKQIWHSFSQLFVRILTKYIKLWFLLNPLLCIRGPTLPTPITGYSGLIFHLPV